MNNTDRLDLMVDALDLLGRLDDRQLVVATALMQAMLPPRARRIQQAARIETHVGQLEAGTRDRLAALLAAVRGEA